MMNLIFVLLIRLPISYCQWLKHICHAIYVLLLIAIHFMCIFALTTPHFVSVIFHYDHKAVTKMRYICPPSVVGILPDVKLCCLSYCYMGDKVCTCIVFLDHWIQLCFLYSNSCSNFVQLRSREKVNITIYF